MSNQLPGDAQRDYANTFPAFQGQMQSMGQRVGGMLQGFIDQHAPQGGSSTGQAGFGALPGGPDDDMSDRFDSIVDLTDRMLERVDADLDRHNALGGSSQQHMLGSSMAGGRPHQHQLQRMQQGGTGPASSGGDSSMPASAMSAGGVKPQNRWRSEVDNSSHAFVPNLRSKPNAIVPLELRLEQPDESQRDGSGGQTPWYANPYLPELAAFTPSDAQVSAGRERLYLPLHAAPWTWVDTEALLQQMVARLAQCSEIALDLEAHSYRSYRGFTCLMQISTRDEDFLVDAIELRGSLQILNNVLTDPRITKVMHGADSDILWLQRDFGLYVVGLFDTGQASRVLELPSFALAHLLKHYCGVTPNKALQTADWRIRPLTQDMLSYAREDTHYLLYVYDRMKADLSPAGRCLAVWQRSTEVCRQAYKVAPFDPEAHIQLVRRANAVLTPPQLACHRVLFGWRDAVAREDDESPAYVLPNHQMLRLATAMPATPEQLHAVCHPLPPILHYRASSLLAAIQAVCAEHQADSSSSSSAQQQQQQGGVWWLLQTATA